MSWAAHPVEQRARITELDVHGAAVRAGLGEVVEQLAGVVDHQVAVEVKVGARAQATPPPAAPIVRFGTKWPSITSTCRRSASGATRSTSAASTRSRRTRIDGAIFIWRRALPCGPTSGQLRRNDAHEHAVGAARPAGAGARARTVRPPRCAGRRLGDEAGEVARRPARRRRSSRRGSACTPSRRAGRRAHRGRGAAQELALERRRAVDRDSGSMRQRASGRRRSTPRPEHGASTSTRSNAPGATGSRRPSAATGVTTSPSPRRVDGLAHESEPTGVEVGGHHEPVVDPLRRARWPCPRARRRPRAPARPAADRARRPPPGCPGPGAWPGPRRPPAGRPDHRSRRRRARRARPRRARRARRCASSSSTSASDVVRRGFARSVTAAGSLPIASSGSSSARGTSVGELGDDPVRHTSTAPRRSSDSGQGGPGRRDRRSTAFTSPRARRRRRAHGLVHRGVRRDVVRAAGTCRVATPPARAARGGRAVDGNAG